LTTLGTTLGVAGAMKGAANAIDRIKAGDYVGGGLALVQSGADVFSMMRSCFTAETKLLTRLGWIRMDQLTDLDEVSSSDENDPSGAVEFKRVLKVFELPPARIWHVHVQGQVIRTTAEHPFYVWGKGWVAARELAAGDRFRSHNGRMVAVEEVLVSGVDEVVYNCAVEEYHTYFVGDTSWGFSVWAHNTCGVIGVNRGNGGSGGRLGHARTQAGITRYAGGNQEQRIYFPNGRYRVMDNVDASGRIHQVGAMRSRGGSYRPSARERAAIEDVRQQVGNEATIIFHDRNGRLPTLINPDLQPGWRPAPPSMRINP
jgi:hypothetical protein